jgi:signal transduction histidine kinase/DNA-binding NarL/FixJ family response regulator
MAPAWIAIVAGLGTALSLTVFGMLRAWEKAEADKRALKTVQEELDRLEADVSRSTEVLYSLGSLHSAQNGIHPKAFHEFVRAALARQPELQALSWDPLVPDQARAEFEQAASTQICKGFEFRESDGRGGLIAAQRRSEYVPVYLIEPAEGNAGALGFDLASDACRRACLERARDLNQPVATAPVQLTQDLENEAGFLVLLPVFEGGKVPMSYSDRRKRLRGYAVAVFRVPVLMGRTLLKLKREGIEAAVYDSSDSVRPLVVMAGSRSPPSAMDSERTLSLEIANRRWLVTYRPAGFLRETEAHVHSWLVLLGGLAFTGLTTAFLGVGWHQTQRIADAKAALEEEVQTRQRAEAAAASANQAKSDFLANMSHEMRTPLNAVLGYTQLLQRDFHLTTEQRDSIHNIGTSGQHLLGLINEILDFSKIEAGKIELAPVDFDLGALGRSLAAIFQPLCAENRIGFRLEFGKIRQHWVRGDEGKLRQILINLIGNAVKFTRVGEVYLRFEQTVGPEWQFEVIDTGLGIPEEEQPHIFQPFHQGSNARYHGGTGLGLAIAQRLVAEMGGTLHLQSERGIGSRFYFAIPLPMGQPGAESPSNLLEIRRLKAAFPVSALVIDDSRTNREILGRLLRSVGCEVFLAASGKEGLAKCAELKPQIVFLDLLMPGMDGIATARQIVANGCGGVPKVVAQTAAALAPYREQALGAGCCDFLVKPLKTEDVYECLRIQLNAEFEYAPSEKEVEPSFDSLDRAGPVTLPNELYSRMMAAAELHSATALKTCLQELRELGPDARNLSERIRWLLRSYDMEGIGRLISSVAIPRSFEPVPDLQDGGA